MPDPTGEVHERLAQQASTLAANVETLSASVTALAESQRRVKRAMFWTVVGLVFDLLLSIVVTVVAVQASNASEDAAAASSLARRNEEYSRLSCEAGNEARAVSRQLWTYVLDLSSQNPNLTAYQRKQVAQFRVYLATAYAPRDCSATTPTAHTPTATPTR